MIKFLHLVCMLIFVSGFILSFISWRRINYHQLRCQTSGLIGFLLLSIFFGVILVHQKGYFFTTPWIKAALIFSLILLCILLAIFYLRQKRLLHSIVNDNSDNSIKWDTTRIWLLRGLAAVIIVAIIHDAVTKTTGLL